jgi:hypothetical protein
VWLLSSYQIQSGNHGAQVGSDHDGGKLEGCSILHVVIRVTLRYVVLLVFFSLLSAMLERYSLGVLLCALLAGFNLVACGRQELGPTSTLMELRQAQLEGKLLSERGYGTADEGPLPRHLQDLYCPLKGVITYHDTMLVSRSILTYAIRSRSENTNI